MRAFLVLATGCLLAIGSISSSPVRSTPQPDSPTVVAYAATEARFDVALPTETVATFETAFYQKERVYALSAVQMFPPVFVPVALNRFPAPVNQRVSPQNRPSATAYLPRNNC